MTHLGVHIRGSLARVFLEPDEITFIGEHDKNNTKCLQLRMDTAVGADVDEPKIPDTSLASGVLGSGDSAAAGAGSSGRWCDQDAEPMDAFFKDRPIVDLEPKKR